MMRDGIKEFEDWCHETGTNARTSYMIVWTTAWSLAQEAQKQKDLAICKGEKHRLNAQGDGDYAIGADICIDALQSAAPKPEYV